MDVDVEGFDLDDDSQAEGPEDAAVRPLLRRLRDALAVLDARPCQEEFARAGVAADAVVDATIAKKRGVLSFGMCGPELLERFATWASLFPTAWHESGHAVTLWALGRPVAYASVIPNEIRLGFVTHGEVPIGFDDDDPRRAGMEAGMVAFAGEIAEEPFVAIDCPGARARKWFAKYRVASSSLNTSRGSDRDRYSTLAWRQTGEAFDWERMLEHWRGETVALLQRYNHQVERVALALLERRELGAEALVAILGPSPERWQPPSDKGAFTC